VRNEVIDLKLRKVAELQTDLSKAFKMMEDALIDGAAKDRINALEKETEKIVKMQD